VVISTICSSLKLLLDPGEQLVGDLDRRNAGLAPARRRPVVHGHLRRLGQLTLAIRAMRVKAKVLIRRYGA
jgi:hypothetical protein